jgi:hypothetical protein
MTRHFPYVTAIVATAAVGAITSVAGLGTRNATSAFAAQVPVVHPVVAARPAFGGGSAPSTGVPASPNLSNTPGTGPMVLPPGFQQSAAFGRTGLSQAGQPPFGEMLYSVQTYMNQPGQPDYYDRLGINPTALQASEGLAPLTAQPPPPTVSTSTATSAPPNSLGQQFTPTNTGSSVGFYNGFGPGNPNFGFYAGFTTPR